MKFFMTLKKKKVVATMSCTGDAATVQLPLPMPLPPGGNHCKSCKKPEGYALPGLASPPLHTINSRLQQPSPRSSELCAGTRTTLQLHVELHDVPLSSKMLKVLGADGREEEKIATCLKYQKKPVRTWPCLTSDAEESLRGMSPNALVTHFVDPGTAEVQSRHSRCAVYVLKPSESTETGEVLYLSPSHASFHRHHGRHGTHTRTLISLTTNLEVHVHQNLYQHCKDTPTQPRLTTPSSQLLLQTNPGLNFEPIQHVPRVLSFSPSGIASPLHCTSLQAVPSPPQRWTRGAKIGSGSFGCVYEGWNLDNGSFLAVKVSDSDNISPEINQENRSIYIFLELVKMGSLQSIMKKFRGFNEVLISLYTHQILKGLEYLHAKNTIYRDIKCANILVDSDGQVKLGRFWPSKTDKGVTGDLSEGLSVLHGSRVDIGSLGCTVLEMADGNPPWSGLHGGYGFLFKVTNGELPPVPEHLSDKARDFITRCLRTRPEDRPTMNDLLVHPFVAYAPSSCRASVLVHD